MAEPDLTAGRALARSHMHDECRIERDPQGVHDNVLDINTGLRTAAAGDSSVIFTGACLVTRTAVGQEVNGARVVEHRGYRIRLPYEAPEVRYGDTLTLTACRDAVLEGKVLRVIQASQGGTYRVQTTVHLEEIGAVLPQ